jgi:hypothetical protein
MPIHENIFTTIKLKIKNPHVFRNVIDKNTLTWKKIENYLNNYVNLYYSSVYIIDSKKITKSIDFPWSSIPCVDPQFLFEQINNGRGFIIHNFSRSSEKINNVCDCIEKKFRQTVTDVHVYAGLSNSSQSFPAHWDFVDNFILQQEGRTEWIIYNEFATESDIKNNNQVDNSEKKLTTQLKVILNPGDILYLPAFVYHKAVPLEKRISLSIPVPPERHKTNREWYKLNY